VTVSLTDLFSDDKMTAETRILFSMIFLTIAYELLTLAVAGSILAHAGRHVFVSIQTRKSPFTNLLLNLVWLGLVLFLITLWPNSSYPQDYPTASFLFFASVAAIVLSLANHANPESQIGFIAKHSGRILLLTGCLVLVFLTVRYLVFYRPRMLGADFYYYLVVSRHMSSGFDDISFNHYFYFPGIFAFWRSVFLLINKSIDSIQWVYLFVIVLNSLLVGLIVHKVVKNLYMAVFAGMWYVLFCARFEGLLGVAEPIATLPILVGLLIWGGGSITGSVGLVRLIALGVGLGLGLYGRQFAGLVSLGALSLLPTYWLQDKKQPVVSFRRLLLLPLISGITLLIGILLEGYGLHPLIVAFKTMPDYGFHSNFLPTLWNLSGRIPLLTILSLLSIPIWSAVILFPRFRFHANERWWQMLGFTCLAGFLSLLSFLSRDSAHYGLFSGPMFIIAGSITVVILIRACPLHLQKKPVFYFVLIVFAVFPFIRDSSRSEFYLWPPERPLMRPRIIPWHLRPEYAADLATMKRNLEPMEKIYVLPPSQNDIHFFLGTRYTEYGWFKPVRLTEVLKTEGLQGVVVVNRDALHPYYADLADKQFNYGRSEEILKAHQYEPVVQLRSMILWRKDNLNPSTRK
jgi:hypothetical protein